MSNAITAPAFHNPDIILDILHVRWKAHRHAEKLLARSANVSGRCARNWLTRRNRPQVHHVIEMVRNDPEFADRFIRALHETRRK